MGSATAGLALGLVGFAVATQCTRILSAALRARDALMVGAVALLPREWKKPIAALFVSAVAAPGLVGYDADRAYDEQTGRADDPPADTQ